MGNSPFGWVCFPRTERCVRLRRCWRRRGDLLSRAARICSVGSDPAGGRSLPRHHPAADWKLAPAMAHPSRDLASRLVDERAWRRLRTNASGWLDFDDGADHPGRRVRILASPPRAHPTFLTTVLGALASRSNQIEVHVQLSVPDRVTSSDGHLRNEPSTCSSHL